MEITRRVLLATTGTSLVLAGCLSTGNGSNGDSDGGDGGDESTVQVRSHDEFGDILVDADGMSLYLFDIDEQASGESACYDDCADAWPPLTVTDEPIADGGVSAELTTIDRDDGSMQVAANGWPVYYFVDDESPGDTNGQGVNDVWWVIAPDGTKVTEATQRGGGFY